MADAVTEWLTVKEFLSRYKGRISRNTLYDRVADNSIPAVRLGRKVLLPADALDRLLQGKADGAGVNK